MKVLSVTRDLLLGLPVSAYIFDNDGTLVETEYAWYEAYERLLHPYGLMHSMEVHRLMMGQSPRACIETLQRAHSKLPQGEAGIATLQPERRRLFRAVRHEKGIRPIAGADAFLQDARVRRIPIAMATSATREDITSQNQQLGWDQYFPVIVTADDVERHKPEPDVYLAAARVLGVDPERCLAFEDAANGLLSARAAGMLTVFLRDPRFGMSPPFVPTIAVQDFRDLLT